MLFYTQFQKRPILYISNMNHFSHITISLLVLSHASPVHLEARIFTPSHVFSFGRTSR